MLTWVLIAAVACESGEALMDAAVDRQAVYGDARAVDSRRDSRRESTDSRSAVRCVEASRTVTTPEVAQAERRPHVQPGAQNAAPGAPNSGSVPGAGGIRLKRPK
jgi:hypothetical protein